jgi:hypothetical protein
MNQATLDTLSRLEEEATEKKFWKRVIKTDSCWNWVGPTCYKHGIHYGRFWFDGRSYATHRYSYERRFGSIPGGLVIDHKCRNTICVNPGHLRPLTNKENILLGNGAPAINARKKLCNNGHAYDIKAKSTKFPHRDCSICRKNRLSRYYNQNKHRWKQYKLTQKMKHKAVEALTESCEHEKYGYKECPFDCDLTERSE